MENKYPGDSIGWEVRATDPFGTVIPYGSFAATASLTVVDSSGTVRFSGSMSHAGSGVWRGIGNTDGSWSLGPLYARAIVKGDQGTVSFNLDRQYRLVGSSSFNGYIYPEELSKWYANIGDYEVSIEDKIEEAARNINSKLEALGYYAPVKIRPDGVYDQFLMDWNAYEALFRITSLSHTGFTEEEKKPWFYLFKDLADDIHKKVKDKVYSFYSDYSPGEAGISEATKVAGSGSGSVFTNWREKGVFQDSSFDRTWKITVSSSGGVVAGSQAVITWTNDDSLNVGTLNASFDWQELEYGAKVRFSNGSFLVGDEWNFTSTPRSQTAGGVKSARSY